MTVKRNAMFSSMAFQILLVIHIGRLHRSRIPQN